MKCKAVIVVCCSICTFIVPTIGRAQVESATGSNSQSIAEHRGLSKILSSKLVSHLVMGAALTGLALPLDHEIRSEISEATNHEMDWSDVGNGYGNGVFLGVASLTTAGLGLAIGNDDLRTTGTVLVNGLAIDWTAVVLLKYATMRQRPDGSDRRSFPSGHSSGAFTFSTILVRRYGWRIAIPAYALAATTAYARMEDDRHFLSDVVAGAAIGIAVGELVAKRPNRSGHSIVPIVGAKRAGLRFEF